MFREVTAKKYQEIFSEAYNLLRSQNKFYFDLHELAHQATEIILLNPALNLTSVVSDLFFSCDKLQVKVKNIVEIKKDSCCAYTAVENLLDLGRLYLTCMPLLNYKERHLFLKIWSSSEDLTDEETALIEQLGKKIREVFNVKTSTKAISYKVGGRGKNQVVYWNQIISKISGATKVDTPRD